MDGNSDNLFKLRFHGNGVTPDSFSAKELGELLISLDEGLKSIVENKFPDVETDDCKISLVKIENESESLTFLTQNTKEAFIDFASSIADNTYTNQPAKAYDAFKHTRKIAEEKKCNVELVYKGKTLYAITPDAPPITKPETVLINVDTVLYGELYKVGNNKSFKESKSTSKAWIQLLTGQKLSFQIRSEQSLELSPYLSKVVALKGQSKFNVLTNSVHSFKLYDIIPYKQGNVSKGFEEIRNISSGFWDKFQSDKEITQFLKGE